MKALKKGTLIKQPCEKCQKLKVHAHHENYDLPLIVNWLCSQHHRVLHKAENQETQ